MTKVHPAFKNISPVHIPVNNVFKVQERKTSYTMKTWLVYLIAFKTGEIVQIPSAIPENVVDRVLNVTSYFTMKNGVAWYARRLVFRDNRLYNSVV